MLRIALFCACLILTVPTYAQVVEGPPLDPTNPPAGFRVTYKGETRDVPLLDNLLVTPDWWDTTRQPYNPPTSGTILLYRIPQRPGVPEPLWRVEVVRKRFPDGSFQDWMRPSIYDGKWIMWGEYRFRAIEDTMGRLKVEPF